MRLGLTVFPVFLSIRHCSRESAVFRSNFPALDLKKTDFRTENAPAIHSSSGAFLLAVFGFYRLLTASVLYGIAGRLSLSYSAAHFR